MADLYVRLRKLTREQRAHYAACCATFEKANQRRLSDREMEYVLTRVEQGVPATLTGLRKAEA